MQNTNHWKKASFTSIIAMILCISILLGTTTAWFTDAGIGETSTVQAGNLQAQILKYDGGTYKDVTRGMGDIFTDANGLNWEPGRTEVVFLAAKNSGELALDAALIMEASFGEASLRGALEYAVIPQMDKASYDALGIKTWEELRRRSDVEYGSVLDGQSFVTDDYMLLPGEMTYFVLAVHMKENSDTSYCGGVATIKMKIASTQAPYESGSNGSDYDENPVPKKEWVNMISTLTFEGTTIEPMTEKEGKPAVIYDESRYESKYVLRLKTGDRAQYSNNAVPQAKGGEFKITGWVKKENPNTVASITYWHRVGEGVNEAKTVEIKDDLILIGSADSWQYFEIPVEQLATANLCQFILNNNASTGADAGEVYFDDLRYMYVMDENAYLAQEWAEQLAKEDEKSMMVVNGIDNPYEIKEPLTENLVINGDFSAETGVVVIDGQKQLVKLTGWRANTGGSSDAHHFVEITDEGTLRVEYKVGVNDKKLYKRLGMGLTQTVTDIIPGGTYMVQYDYRITQRSKDPTASWYGPYVYFSSYGPPLPGVDMEQTIDYALVRADGHPDGLRLDGQWHTFSQLVTTSGQADSIGIGMYQWVYEGDSMEVDNVRVYLVDYGPQMTLDVVSKFLYTDMGTTTFTVDIKEDVYTDTANDKNAYATFEVYDGQKLLWSSEPTKFTGEGVTANVEFDLSLMTKKNTPYVVLATLYNGEGTKLYQASKDIYIYDRPATIDPDGRTINKVMPNGDKFDFYMAYAVLPADYAKTTESQVTVLSIGNSQNAEQTLERLDQCLKYGYMGFLNMNWGLYNDNDISLKRWVMIDVVSDPRVQNHPSLLGYCLTDEPWSWGSEQNVIDNQTEGYRLVRQYDKDNPIFFVNNMSQFAKQTSELTDIMFVDHYDSPVNGTIYKKVLSSAKIVNGRMPLWVALNAYKEKGFFPTSQQARNTVYQAYIAGATGVGWYCISYADGSDKLWEVKDDKTGEPIGEELWQGLIDFKNKEFDISYDHYGDGEGTQFNRKVDLNAGYIYDSWVDKYGTMYLVVLNTLNNKPVDVSIPLTSDNGKVSLAGFTATPINGDDATITGNGTLNVTLDAGNQTILYKITPSTNVDFSNLG